ncbi:MAG: diguanylate cyclase [Candidatus Omnitrophota bacterium]
MKRNKILIIEDNLEDLDILKRKLQNDSYEIIVANEGKSALSLIDQEKPDLIILDIILPDIDGFEICRRIRKNEQYMYLPILFYTSIDTIDEKIVGLEIGASDFLNKNADERELLLRIRNLLNGKNILEETIKFSVIDSLTGSYNRIYFKYRIFDEFELCKRYKRNFSCVFVDIDDFKQINDACGYIEGNNILRDFAQRLRQNIRAADILCRYSGNRFCWMLPETDLHEGYLAAERLRQFFITSEIGKAENKVCLNISCGVSSFLDAPNGVDELLEQSEQALKKAKDQGKNQTRVFNPKGE